MKEICVYNTVEVLFLQFVIKYFSYYRTLYIYNSM